MTEPDPIEAATGSPSTDPSTLAAATEEETPLPPEPPRSRESRAAIAFYVIGVFAAIVWLFIAVAGAPGMPLVASPLLLALGLVALAFVTGYGLDRRRPWALGAMVPLLAILIIAGVVETLVAIAEARINIPLGAILGVWALRGPPERSSGYPIDGGSAALMVLYLVVLIGPYLT